MSLFRSLSVRSRSPASSGESIDARIDPTKTRTKQSKNEARRCKHAYCNRCRQLDAEDLARGVPFSQSRSSSNASSGAGTPRRSLSLLRR